MIHFEEELAKFKPSPEIDEAEDLIMSDNMTDMTDPVSYTHLTLPTNEVV